AHDQVLLGDGQGGPAVEDGEEEVDATRRVHLGLAALREEAEEAGPHPHLGGGGGAAPREGDRGEENETESEGGTRSGAHHFFSAAGGTGGPPGPTPIRLQAERTKVMYCSGVITAPSMFSNILAVS